MSLYRLSFKGLYISIYLNNIIYDIKLQYYNILIE